MAGPISTGVLSGVCDEAGADTHKQTGDNAGSAAAARGLRKICCGYYGAPPRGRTVAATLFLKPRAAAACPHSLRFAGAYGRRLHRKRLGAAQSKWARPRSGTGLNCRFSNIGWHILEEFWPDVHSALHHHRVLKLGINRCGKGQEQELAYRANTRYGHTQPPSSWLRFLFAEKRGSSERLG